MAEARIHVSIDRPGAEGYVTQATDPSPYGRSKRRPGTFERILRYCGQAHRNGDRDQQRSTDNNAVVQPAIQIREFQMRD